MSNEKEMMTEAHLLRLEETAKNGNLTKSDITMATSLKISYTKTLNKLCHMMWSFNVPLKLMFGHSSLVTVSTGLTGASTKQVWYIRWNKDPIIVTLYKKR